MRDRRGQAARRSLPLLVATAVAAFVGSAGRLLRARAAVPVAARAAAALRGLAGLDAVGARGSSLGGAVSNAVAYFEEQKLGFAAGDGAGLGGRGSRGSPPRSCARSWAAGSGCAEGRRGR